MSNFNNSSMNELAKELIEKVINNRKDPFDEITIIVPSLKTEQFLKAYWLKNYDDVLMNVSFKRLDSFLFEKLNKDNEFTLLDKDIIKYLIIKYLSNNEVNELSKYLDKNDEQYSIKLYDVSDKLASLFLDYDKELVQLSGFQKEIYDYVTTTEITYSKEEIEYTKKYTTLRKLFENAGSIELDKPIYLFGFIELTNLQENIVKSIKGEVNKYFLVENKVDSNNVTLTAAPSKLREIEYVHSTICKIIETEKEAKFSDFLVLANDISSYETAISRVFRQDGKEFVNIPYSINDVKKEETNVSIGLRLLFEIIQKKYYTRKDLFELLSNADIQRARNLDDDEVKNMIEAIVSMNAYRKTDTRDDFEYVKNRLLLSKLVGNSNNIVSLTKGNQKEKYIPYSSISMDDKTIYNLVQAIEDLENFRVLFNSIDVLKINENVNLESNNYVEDDIDKICKELDKWFSFKKFESYEPNICFKNVISTLYAWKNLNINSKRNTLVYSLIDASKTNTINSGAYFTAGVTFASFDHKSILEAKYVFFLNASSNELPIKKIKSELDLRNDPFNVTIEKKAFMIQARNAQRFYISFVNKNLSSDEDYYPSSFVVSLFKNNNLLISLPNDNNKKIIPITFIGLDETRPWKDLYTRREFKSKEYFENLLNNDIENIISTKHNYNSSEETKLENERPQSNASKVRMTASQFASYLDEPLKYKAEQTFGTSDTFDEMLNEEYEPFKISSLSEYAVIKKMLENYANQDIEEELKINHIFPSLSTEIQEYNLNTVIGAKEEVVKLIEEKSFEKAMFQPTKIDDVEFDDFILSCNKEIFVSTKDDTVKFFEVKKNEDDDSILLKKSNKILFLYICSLMYVTKQNKTMNVEIYRNDKKLNYSFSITPDKARECLNKIYENMTSAQNYKMRPLNLIYDKEVKIMDLMNQSLENHGSWEFFDSKKMFDIDTQLGYTEKDFEYQFEEEIKKVSPLLPFYNDLTAETEQEKIKNNEKSNVKKLELIKKNEKAIFEKNAEQIKLQKNKLEEDKKIINNNMPKKGDITKNEKEISLLKKEGKLKDANVLIENNNQLNELYNNLSDKKANIDKKIKELEMEIKTLKMPYDKAVQNYKEAEEALKAKYSNGAVSEEE